MPQHPLSTSLQRHRKGKGIVYAQREEIQQIQRQLGNIEVDGKRAFYDRSAIRLSTTAGIQPYLGRIKSGTTDTIEVGFNRSSSGYRDIIIMDDSYNELASTDEIQVTSAIDTYYVYYEIARARFTPSATQDYKSLIRYQLGFTNTESDLGRKSTYLASGDLSSIASHTASLMSSDVTPIWHIPIGIFVNPGQADATWYQIINDQINLDIPRTNLFYSEDSKTLYINTAPINRKNPSPDVQYMIRTLSLSITVNQTTNIYLYADDGDVNNDDQIRFWQVVGKTGSTDPTEDKSLLIGTIKTDSDGLLLSLHDYSMATYPIYYLEP